MTDRNRIEAAETSEELSKLLKSLVWESHIQNLNSSEAEDLVDKFGASGARNDLIVDSHTENLVAILRGAERRFSGGLLLEFDGAAPKPIIRFAGKIVETFVDDLRAAPWVGRDRELWLSLQATRFSRAIAKFSSFHTEMFAKSLLIFENAFHLRYEGQRFSGRLILAKQKKSIVENQYLSVVRSSTV